MAWIQICINTHKEQADALSDLLVEVGSVSVTFEDAKNNPIYEPKPGEFVLWSETKVTGLFDANHDMKAVVAAINESQLLPSDFIYKIEQIEDKDWVREWMDNFHPIKFGERLWICPSWRDIPEPDAINVLLDPGVAFGTGTHNTTALCLEWLDSIDLRGKTLVDFGCGSGILGIAALKLGASRVIGIDIDPQALDASRENAERNGVADKLEVYLPENQPEFVADVVIANILAEPLRELHQVILGLLKSGGEFALSGVLEEQAPSVEAIYSQYATLDPLAISGEWTRISGIKN
jgi:ribosomal protein L11 methyltransferase